MRLVICDDHQLLLEALATALAGHGMTIEATVDSPLEAVRAVALNDPDILLTDLSFPKGSGLDAAREVIAHHPRTRVVVLTGSEQPEPLMEALEIGVSGYLAKDRPIDALARSLRTWHEAGLRSTGTSSASRPAPGCRRDRAGRWTPSPRRRAGSWT